jgi:Mrp family chromosome partitioning ATPase
VVLPARQVSENASELLASPRMARLVAELASRYPSRLIVFDLPPLLCGDEVLSFSPHVDAALLVVREGRTRRDQVRQALAMLDGVNVLGTVLNGASPARTAGTG